MFLQQLNTIATVYFAKFINTGDKLVDNTLTSISVIVCSTLIMNIVLKWKQYYNFCVFWLYRMYLNPLKISKVPYIYDYNAFESIDDFRQKTRNTQVSLRESRIEDMLLSRGIKMCLTMSDIRSIIHKYLAHNNIDAMRDKNDEFIILYDDDIVYPFIVSRSGAMVYYRKRFATFVTTTNQFDIMYLTPFIENYIVEAILNNAIKVSSDDIYQPEYNEDERKYIMKSIGKINKKKVFDTIFYPQKQELMLLLTKFKNGIMYPNHIPIDNKLGILLYGPPGTGKTGTISAIANMLGRSIMIINFAEIKTCKQLDEIINPNQYEKYIYVFDEFDCILDVISGGSNQEKKTDTEDWGKMLLYAEGDERKTILKMMRDGRSRSDSSIDLAYLLQKLDGLESAHNRIIVATTNHPDKINPALLRPGRFDIKICLGLCTKSMIIDILTNFYQGDAAMRDTIAAAQLPENTYSALQLINMAIQENDLSSLLTHLRHSTFKM